MKKCPLHVPANSWIKTHYCKKSLKCMSNLRKMSYTVQSKKVSHIELFMVQAVLTDKHVAAAGN